MKRVGREAAAKLAALHAQCFQRPWTAGEIETMLDHPGAIAFASEDGFVFLRCAADEAEVLTLAVVPGARRRGLGAALIRAACAEAEAVKVRRVFLEVAEHNQAARALYVRLGFAEVGRRTGYYAGDVNAVVMSRDLPL
jgi:ribosomal-protein-alanine N-acetyltransferase